MKKEFESRFMPNAIFHVDVNDLLSMNIKNEFSEDANIIIKTTKYGTILYIANNFNIGSHLLIAEEELVSKYLAAPELVPDGMRYSQEFDKLVPDITPVDDKKVTATDFGIWKKNTFYDVGVFINTPNGVATLECIKGGTSGDNLDYIYDYLRNEFPKRIGGAPVFINDGSVMWKLNYKMRNFTYIRDKTLVPDITPADGFASGGFVSNNILEPVGAVHSSEDFYTEEEGNVVLKHLFSKDEKINTRENGFIKADLDKVDFTLVDPYAYKDLGKQLTIGEKKYSRDNWKKGDILSYLAALERHINDVKIALEEDNIEKLIDDTGVNQGGALMFNSMAVHYFIRQILEKGEKING